MPMRWASAGVLYASSSSESSGKGLSAGVLKMVAKTLMNSARSFDVVGRWGGDEFLAVLPDCAEDGLRRVCETLAATQKTLVIEGPGAPEGPPVPIRFSVGGAAAGPDGQTVEALLERADQAMYQTKKTRRNDCGVEA